MNKKERMYQAIEEHGATLNQLFKTDIGNIDLAKKVKRLETKAHRLTESECNTGEDHAAELEALLQKLYRLLKPTGDMKKAIFINGDPRGYALKIDDTYIREHNIDIHRDWGGYGILAPDFNTEPI